MGARDELALQAHRRAPPWIARPRRDFEFRSSCLRRQFNDARCARIAHELGHRFCARCEARIRLIGRLLAKARMRSLCVVEIDVAVDPRLGSKHRVVGMQKHILVLDALRSGSVG